MVEGYREEEERLVLDTCGSNFTEREEEEE
jgi:hypothetical protein